MRFYIYLVISLFSDLDRFFPFLYLDPPFSNRKSKNLGTRMDLS